jgi:acetyltransferase-like isoleucine patch superfamily enzyme
MSIYKYLSLLFYLLSHPFLRKSSLINIKYLKAQFSGHSHISIGSRNKFLNYSILKAGNKVDAIVIGSYNVFEEYSVINSQQGQIVIGDRNFIGPGVRIQGFGGVILGNHCMIAANVFISSSNHIFSNPQDLDYLQGEIGNRVAIEDYVWIGANCVITSGVTVAHHSIVGAGSVVTKNIRSYTMVAGVPANAIKKYCFESNKWVAIN